MTYGLVVWLKDGFVLRFLKAEPNVSLYMYVVHKSHVRLESESVIFNTFKRNTRVEEKGFFGINK